MPAKVFTNYLYRGFLISAGAIFLVTGVAKIWSAFGSARILAEQDPLFGMHWGYLMLIAGISELLVAGIAVFAKFSKPATVLIVWLSTNLLAYRVGFWASGWRSPCSCLGNLTDAIHVSPQAADNFMKIVLAYLLIGSYGILFYQWWKNRQSAFGTSEMGNQKSELEAGG